MEMGQGDGNKSTLPKTLGQDPKVADRTARTCRKTYKPWNSEQRNCLSLLPSYFMQEKTTKTTKQNTSPQNKTDFVWLKKLGYNKKYLLLSSAYPITETTHKTPKSAHVLKGGDVVCKANTFQHVPTHLVTLS